MTPEQAQAAQNLENIGKRNAGFPEARINPNGILLKCPRTKPRLCGYQWSYTGAEPFVTKCPKCRTTVTIHKVKP